MKKILKIFIFVWLLYLIYLNFFYKGPKILCAMGLLPASAIATAFFIGIFWIGLPISYILKYILNKLAIYCSRKKEPKALGENKTLSLFLNVAKPLIFIFFLPLIFGVFIVFRFFPAKGDIIFSNDNLFFATQLLGLIYIYLGFSGKFNKCLLK